jgi:hypothetical protein
MNVKMTTKMMSLILGLTALVTALGAFPWDWPPP